MILGKNYWCADSPGLQVYKSAVCKCHTPLAKNDKRKVNLTQLQFTKDVWEEVDRHQQEELKLAICGLSTE